jgi:hypothetical protein
MQLKEKIWFVHKKAVVAVLLRTGKREGRTAIRQRKQEDSQTEDIGFLTTVKVITGQYFRRHPTLSSDRAAKSTVRFPREAKVA